MGTAKILFPESTTVCGKDGSPMHFHGDYMGETTLVSFAGTMEFNQGTQHPTILVCFHRQHKVRAEEWNTMALKGHGTGSTLLWRLGV
jgi:hypothetical protein